MRIETLSIDSVKPYERNAKKHPQSQIEQIKASILQFGNNDPIAVDEDGVIIEGHGRYEALKQLGYEEVEVVRLVGLTPEQKKAYILVHNKLTMNTGFDAERLRREIESIQSIDLGVFDLHIDDDLSYEEVKPESSKTTELTEFNLTLAEEQYQMLQRAIEYLDFTGDSKQLHRFGNPNKRSNLIFEVVYQWAEQKMLL